MSRSTLFGTIVMGLVAASASAQSAEIGRIQVGPVAAAAPAATQVETVMVSPAAATTAGDPYDFGLIVQTLQGSVRPLSQELDASFGSFTAKIEQAVTMMDEGRTEAAVELSVEAIREVLAVREGVIEPMWEAQTYLASRIGEIRGRLATAVESSKPGQAEPDRSAEVLLDGIAKRIGATNDPIRKQRLIAHYRTVRDLAAVRQKARKLTPDERNLWAGVLKVLDEAALAHQRVLMGSEVLFAQLESTATRMDDYLQLVRTVQGVNDLVAGVSGLQDGVGGMEGFVEAMRGLSTQLNGFDEAITSALESTMGDLEGRIDAIAPAEGDAAAGVAGIQIDEELAGRLQKFGAN